MDVEKELVEMEKQFWTGGEGFYRENLTEDALMAFPEPVGLMGRGATVESISQAPRWEDVRFEEVHTLRPARDVAILVYQASARRQGEDTPYSALVSSTYVERNGSWKLTLHQQTPGAAS